MLQFFSKEMEKTLHNIHCLRLWSPPSSCVIARWVEKCVLSNPTFVGRKRQQKRKNSFVCTLFLLRKTVNTWGPKWRTLLLNFPALETTGDPVLPGSSPGPLIFVHIKTFYIKVMGSSLSTCCNHPNKNGSFAWFMWLGNGGECIFLVLFSGNKILSNICIKDIGASLY